VITCYRTVAFDDLNVFLQEAGSADAPALLLLHGFPTSSHMFRELIPALADRYHVVAPDLPGFGFTDAPDRTNFTYAFDHLTDVIEWHPSAPPPVRGGTIPAWSSQQKFGTALDPLPTWSAASRSDPWCRAEPSLTTGSSM
jgi:pimeloyl-ACP methyl ester carboxylesterase